MAVAVEPPLHHELDDHIDKGRQEERGNDPRAVLLPHPHRGLRLDDAVDGLDGAVDGPFGDNLTDDLILIIRLLLYRGVLIFLVVIW